MRLAALFVYLLICVSARTAPSPFPAPTDLAELRSRHAISDAACAVLGERGFVVLGDRAVRGLHEAYPKDPGDAYILVTTDALLQLWHDLYLDALKAAEMRGMHPMLRSAISELRQECAAQYGRTRDPASRGALRDALTVLSVADRLLSGAETPSAPVRQEVAALVGKVRAHGECQAYPGDDYTQYTVRGHYASSEESARYFRGTMWLSRRIMAVEAERRLRDPDAPLRRAITLAHVARIRPQARARLRQANTARRSLAGAPNAVSVEQCVIALERVHGPRWTLERALGLRGLARLRAELRGPAYPAARVRTGSALPGEFPRSVIALVPDHAVPDSVLFRMTMFDEIPGRGLASGLDVAAALGHRIAADELRRTEPRAAAVLAAIERQRPSLRDDGRTVYRGWLGALGALARPDSRAPEFMRTSAWGYEKVNTSLAGWAHLRHASILYAAHAYATMGMSDDTPRGWVEPYPAFYRAMADLADRTARVMRSVGGLGEDHEALLARFSAKCRDFGVYADAELVGTLTRSQGDAIRAFGSRLNRFPFRSKPVIADVATGLAGEVLHAAVGDVNPIIAIPNRRNPVAYVGWVFTYYESERPAGDRLTDAAWQTMLDSPHTAPTRPPWSAQFVFLDRGPRWEVLAPLREAESLFTLGRQAEAVAMLRRTIEQHPDSELATECRYWIGEQCRRERRFAEAEQEWAACLGMHGGDAWDRAAKDLWQVGSETTADRRRRDRHLEGIRELRRLLGVLRGKSSGGARQRAEKRALRLAFSGHLRDEGAPDAPSVEDVVRVCRSPAIREALAWRRLDTLGQDIEDRLDDFGRSALIQDCARFIGSAASPALRAFILVRAIGFGYMEDKPIQAAHSLASCTSPRLARDDASAPFAVAREALGRDQMDDLDRDRTKRRAESGAYGLAERLWYAGRIDDAYRVGRSLALPAASTSGCRTPSWLARPLV